MSVTVTFTDLEAAVLGKLFKASLAPSDVDFQVLCSISEKLANRIEPRIKKVDDAYYEYTESIGFEY